MSRSILHVLAVISLGLFLVACGGTSSSSGASESGLTISPTSIQFSAKQGEAMPAVQDIQISITSKEAAYIGAGYPGQVPSWLDATSLTGSGNNWALHLQVTDTSLPVGSYSATLRVGVARADQSTIGTVDATITYTVRAVLSATPSALNYAYIIGSAAPASQTLALKGDSLTWTAQASQPWIKLDRASGAGSTELSVAADPAGLAAGTYAGAITLSPAGSTETTTVPVVLVVTAPALLADASSLSFAGVNGGALAAQTVHLSMNNGTPLTWKASTGASWIVLDKMSGSTPGTVTIAVNPALGSLAPGTYSSTVTFAGSLAGLTLSQVIPVQLTLTAPSFVVDSGSLTYSGVNGNPLPAQPVHFSLSNSAHVAWAAATEASWIVLDKASGSTPDGLTVSVNPALGTLPSGNYHATITLSGTSAGTSMTQVIPVEMDLTKPTLVLDVASLTLGGDSGRDFSALPVTLSLNTGSTAFAWTLQADQTWVAPELATGTVSSAGTVVHIGSDLASLKGGTYSGKAIFIAQVNGDRLSAELPVILNLESHKLLASDTGVALASMPTLKALTRTLQVRDNLARATAWTAVSSQAWLTVTPSGTAPGDLVVTADPAGLTADAVHNATVTLTSTDPTVENAETVQVGLWVGSTDPAASNFNQDYRVLAVDPIRPYVYVHSRGSDISVYNIYTCALVTTIPAVGTQLGDMTIAHNGTRLFVSDAISHNIIPVQLPDFTIGTPWNVGSPVDAYVQYARSNGKALILVGNGCIFNADTGESCGIPPIGGDNSGFNCTVSASLAGNFYSIDSMVHSLDYTALNGGKVLVGDIRFPQSPAENTEDYAFNPDGTRFYLAVGAPYDFYVVDTAGTGMSLPLVQTLPGGAYPNNAEVARDGRFFGGRVMYGTSVWVYSPNGDPLATYDVAYYGLLVRQLRVSGDGLRMATLANADGSLTAGRLIFTTVAP